MSRVCAGDLRDRVVVYRLVKQESGRSYTVERGEQLADVRARVVQRPPRKETHAGSADVRWDVEVTVRAAAWARDATATEIEWYPAGESTPILLSGTGQSWDANNCPPFMVTMAANRRAPAVENTP